MFDLIVIGGGPGGYTAAAAAAAEGMHVALFEDNKLGGTCLNRGCIPTKALLHSAETFETLKNSSQLGVYATNAQYDFAAIHQRKATVVDTLVDGIVKLMKTNKVEVISSRATIVGAGKVEADGEIYEAKNIIVATGSVVSVPPIPGVDKAGVVTSNDILEGEGVDCKSLVIIGGGVIGVECASIYNALGCQVTILEMADHILPLMDKEVAQRVTMFLKKKGITVITKSAVKSIEEAGDQLTVNYVDKKEKELAVTAEKVLVAAGRRANTAGLFADNAQADGFLPEIVRGAIVGDVNGLTSVPGMYVIGDAKAYNIQLAHVASAQAKNAVSVIAGREPEVDINVIPSCVYTSPEVASVGMSEADAKEAGIPVKTGKCLTGANGKSLIEESESGYVKLVVSAEDDVIIGASMVCHRATDLIAELALAVTNKLTLKELAAVVHPHPTFCEMVGEAIEAVK